MVIEQTGTATLRARARSPDPAVVVAQTRAHGVKGAHGASDQRVVGKDEARAGKGSDRQAVVRGDHLGVDERCRTFAATDSQSAACARHQRLDVDEGALEACRHRRQRLLAPGDRAAAVFEVAGARARRQVPGGGNDGDVVVVEAGGTQLGAQLVSTPREIESLFTRPRGRQAVGVGGGEKGAVVGPEYVAHERQRCPRGGFKPGITGELPGINELRHEQRVVVEHLFKVRHEPAIVDAVAVHAAADLIEQPATDHPPHRQQPHLSAGRIAGSFAVPKERTHRRLRRKLRRRPHAAILFVEARSDHSDEGVNDGETGRRRRRCRRHLRHKLVGECRSTGRYLLAVVAPGFKQAREHRRKTEPRTPLPVVRRKVRARVERLSRIGREPQTHRPPTTTGHRLQGLHVDGVDVGALFAIELDADVALVHQRGDVFVFEALVFHHVTPVARGVADAQKHGHVTTARFGKGRITPRPPVDRVVQVLQQIRRRLPREMVAVAGRAVGGDVARAGR